MGIGLECMCRKGMDVSRLDVCSFATTLMVRVCDACAQHAVIATCVHSERLPCTSDT